MPGYSTFISKDLINSLLSENTIEFESSRGSSLMTSGFCCECHGFINLNGVSTHKKIKPGPGNCWCQPVLIAQFKEVAPVLKAAHEGCEIVCVFDHSSNHCAKAPDALDAEVLNMKDGGKPLEHGFPRSTKFTDRNWVEHVQHMNVTNPDGSRQCKGITK